MIVVCRRQGCDKTVRTPFPDIQPYCAPECAHADRLSAFRAGSWYAADRAAVDLSAQEIGLTNAQIDAIPQAPACPPVDAAAGDYAGAPIAEAATVQEPAPCTLAVADELDDPDIVLTEVTSIVDSDEKSGKYAGKYSGPDCNTDHKAPFGEPVGFDEPKPQGWLARAIEWVRR
jgi:hypothetical protein